MKRYIYPILIVALSYLLFFHQLDRLPLRLWDESRNAVHAMEMLENGNYLVRTFDGAPDMYELKPPLLTWLQVAGLKVLGIDDLAIRLPSALAGTAIALLLFFFMRKRTSEPAAFLASVLFMTAHGVLGNHLFRNGDHDALLVLWLTLAMLSAWKLSEEWSNKQVILIVVFTGFAVFTKSIMGLAFAPAIFVWLLSQKLLIKTLKTPSFWLSLVLVSVAIGLYYHQRELASPGYLEQVNNNELFRRYLNTSETFEYTEESFWYYGVNIFERFKPFWITLPLMIFLAIKRDKMGLFLILFFGLFFLAISFGTKNYWYDGPLFPVLALLCSRGLYVLFKGIKPRIQILAVSLMALGLVIVGKKDTVVHENPAEAEFYSMSWELRDWHEQGAKNNGIIVVNGFNTQVKFYSSALNKSGSKLIHRKPFEVTYGDTIFYAEQSVFEHISKEFTLNPIEFESDRVNQAVLSALPQEP